MKRIFRTVIVAVLLVSLLIPSITVYAATADMPEWEDVMLTQEQFNEILSNNPANNITPLATGLIGSYSIAIAKDGNTLLIAGDTHCSPEVVKCGFTKVTIQRKVPTSAKWTDYITYKDLYIDDSSYTLTKSVVLSTGYQYRVTCTHYAKKSLLSTQKIDNVSNVLIFV